MTTASQEVLAMPDAQNGSAEKWVPPYISFRTLLNLFERMESSGVPPRIDRSYLENLSGGYQTQVMATLKALDLIEDDGTVRPVLTALATDRASRKGAVAELVRRFYPEPVRLGSVNATRAQLEDVFKKYEITGATLRKAIAFFLHAATFAEIPLSPYFGKVSPGTATRKTARKRIPAPNPPAVDGGPTPPSVTPDATTGITPLKKQYVEMLLKKAETQEQMDEGLLDRIEALLGFETEARQTKNEPKE
jgi:hypothetical protein